ncbi:MFS transporter [Spirillospora sp. NPDC000708]
MASETRTLTGPAGALRRTRGTLGLYGALGCLGYMLTALGAILPQLREERGLPRGEVALYPSAFALGLVIVGLVGHRLAGRLGRYAPPAALTALVAGAAIMAAGGGRLGAGLGALVLGLGGAGLVQLIPAALRALHGGDGTVPIGEANAVASTASVLAPLAIGAAVAHGPGWRPAFVVPPLAVAAVLLITRLTVAPPAAVAVPPAADRAPRTFRSRWLDLVLAVGTEFCMMFWAADFLGSVKSLSAGTAAMFSTAFVLGMALARAAAAPLVRLARGRPDRLVAAAAGVGLAGFAVLWTAPAPFAVAGLLVVGLGVALLYPVILGQALAAWPSQPARASARCALASGVAIGTAPLVLGALADLTTLRAAVFVAPALLLALLARRVRRTH